MLRASSGKEQIMNWNAILKVFSAVGKWAGRLTALLLLVFWGAFFVEHLTEWFLRGDGRYPPAWVWRQQSFHLVMLVGLGMMLKWERLGAVVMTIGTLAFFAAIGFHTLPVIALYNLVPIACFSVYWLARWRLNTTGAQANSFLRPQKAVLVALGATFTAFVVLSANEILGNPPLMTPALQPLALAGSWQAKADAWPGPSEIEILFTVSADGSVSGKIGDATLASARITRNRTWLGQAINWRTGYIIRGELDGTVGAPPLRNGNRLSAPLNLDGPDLVGSLFTAGKDTRGNRVTSAPLVRRLRLKKM
jgi:hypothetical protein